MGSQAWCGGQVNENAPKFESWHALFGGCWGVQENQQVGRTASFGCDRSPEPKISSWARSLPSSKSQAPASGRSRNWPNPGSPHFCVVDSQRDYTRVDATIFSLITQCFQHSLIKPAFHSRHCLLMLLKARFVARAAQTRVLLVILLCCRCCASS